jgi:predicted ATPase
VECVYLITDTGLLIKDVMREETKLDSTIFAGMLTAVGEFVKDSLSMLSGEDRKEALALNSLGYENYRILIESGTNTNLAVILTGRENEFLINDIRETLLNVEEQFGNILKAWDGDDNSVKGIDILLKPLITSGKYDGIDYAKDDPQIKRNLLFENILLGITRYSKVNPSILCIEDLQWVDPSTLALMHYVARNTRKCNLLILGTYRPEDVTATKDGKVHHLIESMQLMSREDLFQQIELGRLGEGYIDEMLISLLGETDFSDEFKIHLFKETEGNPFFIVSLMRMLIEEKTIEKKDGVWVLSKDLKEVNIPSKVYDVIVRRLYRVKEKEREILEYAAVIGEEFTSDILDQAGQYNKIELLKQLRSLEQNHKLIISTEFGYKFDHSKIKEVLYSQVPMELRREYHAVIANSIETLCKENLNEVIENLAFHYYRCKNREKALFYLIKAAEKAKKDYSNEEAIGFYNEALEFEADAQKRAEIYETQADIYRYSGDYIKSIKSFFNAIKLIEEKHKKAEIKGKIGWTYEKMGAYDASIKIGREALDLVRGEGCKEEAYALIIIGYANIRLGNYNRVFESFKKSLEIGQKIDDQFYIAMAFKGIALFHKYRGEYDKAIEALKKSLESWVKLDDLRNIATEKFNIAFNLGRLGKFERALECYEKSWEIAEKIGSQDNMAYISWGQAEVYCGKGDLDRALINAHQAFEISRRIGLNEVIAESYRMFGMIYGKQKKWEESIKNFEQSFRIFKELGMKMELGENHYEFGLMWKEKGDIDKAKEHLNKALNIFEELKIEKKMEKVRKEL